MVPLTAHAQDDDESLMLRIYGDTTNLPGETIGTVIVTVGDSGCTNALLIPGTPPQASSISSSADSVVPGSAARPRRIAHSLELSRSL
jgi:hypothetical protein